MPPSTQAPFVNEPMAPVATPTTTPAPIVPTATTTTTPPPITLTVGTTVVKPGVVTVPVATPVVEPGAATGAPTESANGSTGGVPPEIQCNAFNVNYPRMCSSDKPCCSESRVDTTFCWESYEELGDAVESACFHCCETPMQVGPAAVPKPELPKTIACSGVDNAHRMCKSDGCCTNPRSETDYCQSLYDTFNDSEMSEVCHYCCSTSQEVGPSVRRNLRLPEKAQKATTANGTGSRIPEGAKVFNVYGRQFVLGPENFERDEEDEHAYFQRMYDDHKRRSLQVAHSVNYDDIEWVPYEWLMKVGTEYYYRYEGTMLVPPCWETVHWRTMKDPIQVHERQIAELNRLLAWRVNPDTCEVDTAGVLQEGGNTVRMDRELQYMHKQHRQVFCECKDWGSKFAGDVEWCDNWEEDVNFDRFYTRPYSFESGWLP